MLCSSTFRGPAMVWLFSVIVYLSLADITCVCNLWCGVCSCIQLNPLKTFMENSTGKCLKRVSLKTLFCSSLLKLEGCRKKTGEVAARKCVKVTWKKYWNWICFSVMLHYLNSELIFFPTIKHRFWHSREHLTLYKRNCWIQEPILPKPFHIYWVYLPIFGHLQLYSAQSFT
jgi:hypothetical protein